MLGESEILGQVRTAWQVARDEGGARSTLDLLFRHALHVGKRTRTETAIGRGTASISHAAVEMVGDRLGTLAGRRVLVVGAGDMGVGVATALHRAGVGEIVVVNRTPERGAAPRRAGRRVRGRPRPDRRRPRRVRRGRRLHGVGPERRHARRRRGQPGARAARCSSSTSPCPGPSTAPSPSVDGVTLLDLDDLRDWADRGLAQRAGEADRARAIVAEELERFNLDVTARQAAPLVAELHERAEGVRQQRDRPLRRQARPASTTTRGPPSRR